MAEAALDAFGRIDALVNNAAIFLDPEGSLPRVEHGGVGRGLRGQRPHLARHPRRRPRDGVLRSSRYPRARAGAREWDIAANAVSPEYIPHDPGYAGRQPEMADLIAEQRANATSSAKT